MSPEAVTLLGSIVVEVVRIIVAACQGTPPPTAEALRASVQAAIAAHAADADWLKAAVATADAAFTSEGVKG